MQRYPSQQQANSVNEGISPAQNMLPRMAFVFHKPFKLLRDDNDASVEMLLKNHKV